MKALFIGGTGTISSACVARLAQDPLWEVWLLNRGRSKRTLPEGVHTIQADIGDEAAVRQKLEGLTFDTVCEFIGFDRADVERDYRLFAGRTKQYIYTSSASAYHKPARSYLVTEGTTLANPYWDYSRGKIEAEDFLFQKYREEGFPVTIVRPSHTYDAYRIPVAIHGKEGSYQVVKRIVEEKPVIIPGDGTSLWTVTYHTDFAIGYTGLMGNPKAIGEAFHITGDESLTWNEIYATIADALDVGLHPYHVASDFLDEAGKNAGYDFAGSLLGDKSGSVVFDNSKLKCVVPGMRTEVPFYRGVRLAVETLRQHPEACREDPAFDAWTDQVIAAQEAALASFR